MMRAAAYALLTSFWIAVAAAAGDDPNLARGITPGSVYKKFDVDTVNQFNGNLVIRIPLGDAFPVGPLLNQQLTLSYNSKVYDYEFKQYRNTPDDSLYKNVAIPEKFSNAGLGWIVSMGMLVPPVAATPTTPERGWVYRAGDGSEYDFTLGPEDPAVAYTHDGTYLRMKREPANTAVAATAREIEFPDGTTHRFEPSGQVKEIRDRLGHWIRVNTDNPAQWVIANGYAGKTMRTSYVNFSARTAPTDYTYAPNFQRVVSSVELPAFGTTTRARFEFTYADTILPRDGCGDLIEGAPTTFAAPLLTEIRLPDESTYALRYQTTMGQACATGLVTGLTLPTKGSIEWTHQPYRLSQAECDDGHGWTVSSPGVHERTLKDAQGTPIAVWTYVPAIDIHLGERTACGAFDGKDWPWGPAPTEATTSVSAAEIRNGVRVPVGGKTVHYFSATLNGPRAYNLGYDVTEYGLPFTRRLAHASNASRFLSTERYDESQLLVRSSYLTYAGDAQPFGTRLPNARVQGELTAFNADTGCGGACRIDVDRSDYAQYGRYERSVTSSNFGPSRTEFTNFTPDAANWILGMYDEAWTEEGGVASRQLFAFDGNGFLRTRRTLAGRAATAAAIDPDAAKDLLEATCRDGRGFVTSERFFGGDGSSAVPAGDPCGTSAVPEYRIDHAFTFDSTTGAPTKHTARYAGMPFFIIDQDLDPNTGLVSAARDVSGVATTYAYKPIGQPAETSITPAGQPWTLYQLFNASASTPAKLRVTTRAAGASVAAAPLTDAYFYYDAFGRLVQEKRKMPSGWATTNLGYDIFNRATVTSVPEFRASSAFESGFTAAKSSTTVYDIFGRPVSVTIPDGKTVTTSYTGRGVRETARTQEVALTAGAAPVTTTELADAFGRLLQVTEPNATRTRYKYDLQGHLAEVCQNTSDGGATCGQKRIFDYDNRGFLKSESHPENGTTDYTYDSRGHVLTKVLAAAPAHEGNLRFTYDEAERLTEVWTWNPQQSAFRLGKVFAFGPANEGTGGANKKLGKLVSATRYNYNAGQLTVKESYDYTDPAGRLKKTTTEIARDGSLLQTLEQSQTWESGGRIGTLTYPSCLSVSCGTAAWNTSTLSYTNGLLTRVDGFADAIAYGAAGAVAQVDHSGPVTDTYTPDETGVRPKSISFAGQTACAGPAIQTGTPQDTSVPSNQTATLTVSATDASGYQWFEANGTKIAGQTSATFTTPPLTSARSYYAEVYSDCETVPSRTATVSVCPALSISSGTPQDQSIQTGDTATLTVSANGATSYQWYQSNGTPIAGQTSSTYTTPPLTSSKSYYAVASNACASVQSRTATVTVCPPLSITPGSPQNQSIRPEQTATLSAPASGATSYQWYQSNGTPIAGQTSSSYTTPPLTSSKSYYVVASNACGSVQSRTATVTVRSLAAPAGLQATANGTTSVALSWSPSTDADHYVVDRKANGTGFTPFRSVSGTSTTDATVAAGTTYVYRVRAVSPTELVSSPAGNADLATTIAFSSLTVDVTGTAAAQCEQLLAAVNALRAANGSAIVTWTSILPPDVPPPAVGVRLLAQHILSLRSAMNTARANLGFAPLSYTDPVLANVRFKAVHMTEIQGGAQ